MKPAQFYRSGRTTAGLLVLLLACCAVVVGGAFAESVEKNGKAELLANGANGKLEAMIKHRRATMKRVGEHMRAVIAYVKGGPGTPDQVALHASEIQAVADQLLEMFPEGSGTEDPLGVETGAKSEIWASWADFSEQAKLMSVEAAKLKEAAGAGDKSLIRQQFMTLGKNGCSGCHERFRQKI